MKNFIIIFCLLIGLNSCITIKEDLPRDLPKALLIIEKEVALPKITGMKGIGNFATGLVRRNNTRMGYHLERKYATYPFRYAVLDYYQIGDSIENSTTPVYVLMNGSTYTTVTPSSLGGENKKSKTQVLLLNCRTGKVKSIVAIKNGTLSCAGLLNKKIKKQFRNSAKKTTKASPTKKKK